ncbi:doublecortin domain-containing protein 2 isoform X2 [Hyperolius riggenbachi]|uniref:doublecortin domain-containing protein 2 isoform X2 n=1 Tax=Hyperolius riggenbachi TaxID=752182 RepID=UPI0035A3573C
MQPSPAAGGAGRSLAPLVQQPAVKAVHVYRNGDPFFRGRRMLIHEKRVGTFDVFLKDVTGGLQAPFGAVRNIYTPKNGHRVTSLNDLQPGEYYVAGGRESFKKLDYLHIGENRRKVIDPLSQSPSEDVKPVTHSRINVSARFKKGFQEPCTLFLIANGDVMNPVVRLLIPGKVLDQWELVLAMVTDKVKLRSGAVHKLYTLDGTPIQDGSELENGQFYVAVGRDKFKKLPYSDLIFSKASVRRSYGSKASSLPPINGYRKSKENRHERQTKSTGGSSDAVDHIVSPQPPKPKAKRNPEPQILHKPVRVKQKKVMNNNVIYHETDDGIFKAGEDRSEMWGASEVQEDENTKVEVPVDQRVAETVEEEVQDHEEDHDGEEPACNGEEAAQGDHNIPPDENDDYGTITHEEEVNHENIINGQEDEATNEEAELQEEDKHFDSVNGEVLEQINGDMYENEEADDGEEDHDIATDEKSQAESSLPRPTSSRLLEKPSSPTETENKDEEPES